MTAGLALVQESHAAWGRAQLVHYIGQQLPGHAVGRDQEHAWQILDDLTDLALADQAGEDVLRLDAPEWPYVPDSRRRASGESIYRSRSWRAGCRQTGVDRDVTLMIDTHGSTLVALLHNAQSSLGVMQQSHSAPGWVLVTTRTGRVAGRRVGLQSHVSKSMIGTAAARLGWPQRSARDNAARRM